MAATLGSCSTRGTTSSSASSAVAKGVVENARREASMASFGGLPNSTSIGISTGRSPNTRSVTSSSRASVASPTTACGQRSRAQIDSNASSRSAASAST